MATRGPRCCQTLATTARNTLIHPVVLPVLAGLVWNLTGLRLPAVLDELLPRWAGPWCRCAWC